MESKAKAVARLNKLYGAPVETERTSKEGRPGYGMLVWLGSGGAMISKSEYAKLVK